MIDKNYQFGSFFLDTASRNILHQGKLTRLSPRAFEILLHLISRQGQVVKKNDLLESVWADSFVEENTLHVHVSALRRVLNEHQTGIRHIETVSGRGYRFLTPVKEIKTDLLSTLPPEKNEINSIAVLPFVNRNKDEKTNYLAEGITDSLISKLSQISELKVISYSAVSQFKNQQINLQEAGFLLGVDSVLVGSIIEIDGELEISVELVRVSDLSHLWGTQYQCRLEQLFKTKTEISIAIADKLQIQLTKSEAKQLVKQLTDNSEAYQLYLKGKQLADTHSKEGLLKSIDYFNEALKLDPNFALASVVLGYTYLCLAIFFYASTKESVSKAKLAIQIALMIDENLAEAYAIKGYLQLFEFDLDGANKSFIKALKLNDNSAYAHALYSNYFIATGEFSKALKHYYKTIELNPHPKVSVAFSMLLMLIGEFEKAIDNFENSIEIFPNFNNAYYGLTISYALLGKLELALKNAQITMNIICSTENLALYSYIQALAGNHQEAERVLCQLLGNFQNAPVDLYDIAIIYNALGNKDKTFEYIDNAFESKFSHLFLLKIDPRMKSLHSDPRFETVLQKLGLA